ncbi:hypothetical protein GGS26DRAFT_603162 [Hypomontagnella submonticulosa]|nr:hypothetical protein GGS26DRAFT_603162 [Hypomontagnella submonticulosa]
MSTSVSPTAPQLPPAGPMCQAIVFYHICGCKSSGEPVRFCNARGCTHESSTLVVGELPFACQSKDGRSGSCRVEDPAKTRFVREIDSATKIQNLMVLPGVVKEDIESLIPPSAGSDDHPWTEKVQSQYQKRVSSVFDIPPQTPVSTQEVEVDVDLKSVHDEELEPDTRDEKEQNEYDVDVVEQRPGDMEYVEADEMFYTLKSHFEDSHETGLESSMENEGFGTAKPNDKSTGNVEDTEDDESESETSKEDVSETDFDSTTGNVGSDTECSEPGDKDLPEPAWFDVELEGEPEKASAGAQSAEEAPASPRQSKDLYGETGDVTDDFIDFLLTPDEAEQAVAEAVEDTPVENPAVTGRFATETTTTISNIPTGTVMGKIWSLFCVRS